VHIVNRAEEIERKKAPSNRSLKLKAKEFTAEIAEIAEKKIISYGPTRTHTDNRAERLKVKAREGERNKSSKLKGQS